MRRTFTGFQDCNDKIENDRGKTAFFINVRNGRVKFSTVLDLYTSRSIHKSSD